MTGAASRQPAIPIPTALQPPKGLTCPILLPTMATPEARRKPASRSRRSMIPPPLLRYLNLPPTNGGVNVPTLDSRHDFTAEPLTSAAPQISTPRLGQALHAEPLTTKPPELGREPPPDPGVHRLKAAPSRRSRKRDSPRIGLIQTVLRERVPEWSERFPTVEEMPNKTLQIKGKTALARDPRTCGPGWEWNKIRKSFMRAVGREKRK